MFFFFFFLSYPLGILLFFFSGVAVCSDSNIPIGKDFMVLPLSVVDIDQDCLCALLTLEFNIENGQFEPLPGIQILPHYFGDGFKGVAPAYWNFDKNLIEWGYENNLNLFAAPYDYRILSPYGLASNGFNQAMQGLVEKASQLNNNSKVMLIGHSNGGPQAYIFITSMSQAWKDQYLAGLIGLSGNFLGQMNGYQPFFYSEHENRLNMLASWESMYTSSSWGSYEGLQSVGPVVTTYYGSDLETNYTVSLGDLSSLFDSVGHEDWSAMLKASFTTMNRTQAPGVNVHCLYGQGLDTSYSFVFNGTILENPNIATRFRNGDGDQEIEDNTFCNVWNTDSNPYFFESLGFDGVEHTDMTNDANVLEKVREILESY
jgi:lysophospholipase III